jgi:hypothetical protein
VLPPGKVRAGLRAERFHHLELPFLQLLAQRKEV